eukprot:COSAG04_NODE_935_length_9335_cov_46.007687_2_plen_177_part_00
MSCGSANRRLGHLSAHIAAPTSAAEQALSARVAALEAQLRRSERSSAAHPTIQLLGAEASLFTSIVRAYLKVKRIAFEDVLPTPEIYDQVIVPLAHRSVVPVIIDGDGGERGGEQVVVQDSQDIIEYLEAKFPYPSITPPSRAQQLASQLLSVLGHTWLLIPAMHYRWTEGAAVHG